MNLACIIQRISIPCAFVFTIAAAGFAASGSGCSTGSAPAQSGVSSCASPGGAASGPANDRCIAGDGGLIMQPVSASACMANDDAGANADECAYGDTLFNQAGPDDDCKYFASWTSSPICEGGPGVQFTVVVKYNGTSDPVTGAGTRIEYYVTKPGSDGGAPACDSTTDHLGPTLGTDGYYQMTEIMPGTYQGKIVFDQAGAWTVRFHFNENCFDESQESPHGHIAFHVDVNAG